MAGLLLFSIYCGASALQLPKFCLECMVEICLPVLLKFGTMFGSLFEFAVTCSGQMVAQMYHITYFGFSNITVSNMIPSVIMFNCLNDWLNMAFLQIKMLFMLY